jgi:hypothetical protein
LHSLELLQLFPGVVAFQTQVLNLLLVLDPGIGFDLVRPHCQPIEAKPRSDWLPANVLRDPKGFVLTGRDLLADAAYPRTWKERREPLPLETSAPGVFAAGDIRAGAMNRVASAVGEGSMVVRLVHEYLALT